MKIEYTMEDVDKFCKAYDLKLHLFQRELLKAILNKKELKIMSPYEMEKKNRQYYNKILRKYGIVGGM